MKKILHSLFLFLSLLIASFYFSACKKDGNKVSITLHDKPLSVIQKYTKGSWKLQNEKGGFCGNCIFYPTDSTFNLYLNLSSERIKLRNKHFQTLDTIIVWTIHVFNNSTYAFTFIDSTGIPFTFAADGIYNDTLVLYQPTPDGMSFYYTKSN